MIPQRLVWSIGDAPLTVVRESLGDELLVQQTSVDGPWRAPAGARPIAALVQADARSFAELAALVRYVRAGSQVPVVVFAAGLDAETRHALLRAGAAAVEAAPWDSPAGSSARARAAMRVTRAIMVADEPRRASTPPLATELPKLVAIGASTGGSGVLREILTGLDPTVPVLIAQHISVHFDASLADWLTNEGFPTRVATDGLPIEAGPALLAPADRHLAVEGHVARLLPFDGRGAVPSVDALFDSVARGYGRRAVGVLLTGMGDDGARGLLAMKRAGALTITQRGDTCVVDGMPARARDLLAGCEDLPPDVIRERLLALGAFRLRRAAS